MSQTSPVSVPLSATPVVEPKRGWRKIGGGMLIGLIVSASFLVIILRDIRWQLLGTSLRHARIWPLVIATAGFIISYAVIALRWKALLGERRLRFIALFEVLNIGLICNVILPARGGDMVRVVLLHQREHVRRSASLASVLLEKLFDVAALVILLIPAMLWVNFPNWVLFALALAVVGVVIGFVLCIVLARSSRDFALLPLVHRLPARILTRANSFFGAFRDGLRLLFSWRRMVQVCVLSLLIWTINSVAAYFVLFGLRIGGVSLPAIFVVIAIMNLGLIIPSSPGYVGTYEFLGVSALALFHVERELALEYALVLHMLTLLIVVGVGIASMGRLGYSLATLSRDTTHVKEA